MTQQDAQEALSILKQVSATCGPSCTWNGGTREFLERTEAFLKRQGVSESEDHAAIRACYADPLPTQEFLPAEAANG